MDSNKEKKKRSLKDKVVTSFVRLSIFLTKQKEQLRMKIRHKVQDMIGPIEKGFEAAKLTKPPVGTFDGVDLKVLPKYISYKAGILKEKSTLKFVVLVLCILFGIHYASSSHEKLALYQKLREKEYILAPSVVDYTTVVPQNVPESYVSEAVNDFVANLGNINPQSIHSQYSTVKKFMTDRLKVKFDLETEDWLKQVESENISQIFTISEKEISASKDGNYKATIVGRADLYANHQYLGYEDQVIEMQLRLSPPQVGRRWYLEIASLQWDQADTFKTKTNLKK